MLTPPHWNGTWTAALLDHLWQSTVVVLLAWLLAFILRANGARARYWVWMAASVKFLLPFSLVIAAGEALRTAAVSTQQPALSALSAAAGRITQPFAQHQIFLTPAASGTAPAPHDGLILLLFGAWLCGAGALTLSWTCSWWQIRAAVRAALPITLVSGLPQDLFVNVSVLSTTRLLEPGVFGIVRPVLLLPVTITAHLSVAQLRTVVAHELCHIRRRDNLTAALHMAVAALFWFHPAVWWIEARLLEERERACDEAVLAAGSDAELYAESILSVCKFYVESPLACVPGITGGPLKQRIVRIMTGCMTRELSAGRKAMLAVACVLTAAVPFTIGLITTGKATAQSPPTANRALPSFEVASIKPNKSGKNSMSVSDGPVRFVATDTTMKPVLWSAFNVYDFQIVGLPSWVSEVRYDIEAKIDDETQKLSPEEEGKQIGLMVQSLLMERCKLKFHREIRIFPIYSLQIAKNGPKLHEAKSRSTYPDGMYATVIGSASLISVGNGTLKVQALPMFTFAKTLGMNIGHVIVDKTGLQGMYDFTLEYAPDHDQAPPGYGQTAPADTRPPIFTALQEQLGLKLVSEKAPLEVIVIDHIEQPTPN